MINLVLRCHRQRYFEGIVPLDRMELDEEPHQRIM